MTYAGKPAGLGLAAFVMGIGRFSGGSSLGIVCRREGWEVGDADGSRRLAVLGGVLVPWHGGRPGTANG